MVIKTLHLWSTIFCSRAFWIPTLRRLFSTSCHIPKRAQKPNTREPGLPARIQLAFQTSLAGVSADIPLFFWQWARQRKAASSVPFTCRQICFLFTPVMHTVLLSIQNNRYYLCPSQSLSLHYLKYCCYINLRLLKTFLSANHGFISRDVIYHLKGRNDLLPLAHLHAASFSCPDHFADRSAIDPLKLITPLLIGKEEIIFHAGKLCK